MTKLQSELLCEEKTEHYDWYAEMLVCSALGGQLAINNPAHMGRSYLFFRKELIRKIMVENKDQSALRQWIQAGLEIEDVKSLHGDAKYLFNNMIAKYTLSASEYAISVDALKKFTSLGYDLKEKYFRCKFYGKNSPFIYEHAIPASLIREELLKLDTNDDKFSDKVEDILTTKSGKVTVLLRTEDKKLSNKGLVSKMPKGWTFGTSEWSRYDAAEIKISKSTLKVKGALYR